MTLELRDIVKEQQLTLMELWNDKVKLEEQFEESAEMCNQQAMRITELEEQIEKMKCCGNCKTHIRHNVIRIGNEIYPCNEGNKRNCDEWELAE